MGPGIRYACDFQVGVCAVGRACGREGGVLVSSAEGEFERAEILLNRKGNDGFLTAEGVVWG